MAAKKTFEENMARLEALVAQLERGDAPLSESLALFEEGAKLVSQCRKKLAKGADGAPVESDFTAEE